jgi:uncharacterized protein
MTWLVPDFAGWFFDQTPGNGIPGEDPANGLWQIGHTLPLQLPFSLNPSHFETTGARDAILASSGMGKSFLTGVLMEETLLHGGLVCVIDPEGENHTLAERFPLLIVGGEQATVDLNLDTADSEDYRALLETVLTEGISVLFDLSGRPNRRQQALYRDIVVTLFLMQEDPQLQRPIKLIVEEARIYAPQKGLSAKDGPTSLTVSEDIATRGRKRGIDLLIASQRPAGVNKDVLSQCNRFWFGGMQSTQDAEAMEPYLKDAGITFEEIRQLEPGEFYYSFQGKTQKVKVRPRLCTHGGTTPKAKRSRPVATQDDLPAILEGLQR